MRPEHEGHRIIGDVVEGDGTKSMWVCSCGSYFHVETQAIRHVVTLNAATQPMCPYCFTEFRAMTDVHNHVPHCAWHSSNRKIPHDDAPTQAEIDEAIASIKGVTP